MKNYNKELKNRVAFLQKALKASGAKGFVYGNSGGKDSALAGILCKKACADTLGVIMPCGSARNYGEDARDALLVAGQYGIETTTVDLSSVKQELLRVFDDLPVINCQNPIRFQRNILVVCNYDHRLIVFLIGHF